MKAVGLYQYLPAEDENSLQDLDLAKPTPGVRDLLVEVKAISVNPVDTKVRSPKEKKEAQPRILGWDAAGTVIAVGDRTSKLKTRPKGKLILILFRMLGKSYGKGSSLL